jgi:hypothetical protein
MFATGAQVGGLITGEASGKVTDTTITLNTQLDYKSNKVRISTGDTLVKPRLFQFHWLLERL